MARTPFYHRPHHPSLPPLVFTTSQPPPCAPKLRKLHSLYFVWDVSESTFTAKAFNIEVNLICGHLNFSPLLTMMNLIKGCSHFVVNFFRKSYGRGVDLSPAH